MKKLLLLIALCFSASPSIGAQLSTYPALNLAKIAGVDPGGNVGLMAQQPLACDFSIAYEALSFNPVTNAIQCSSTVTITNSGLTIQSGGLAVFPDGSFWNVNGLNSHIINAGFISLQNGNYSSNGITLQMLAPNVTLGNMGAGLMMGATTTNYFGINFITNGSGNANQELCFAYNTFFNNDTFCQFKFSASGIATSGSIATQFATISSTGSFAVLQFTGCSSSGYCGFQAPASGQFCFTVNTGSGIACKWDYGITSSGNFSFGVPIGLKGYTVSTLPAGHIGQEAYVTDATSCTYGGALTGSSTNYCKVTYNGTAWVGG